MTVTLLILIYGLTLLAALCNLPAWTRLSYLAVKGPDLPRSQRYARYAVLLTNIGLIAGCWARLSGTVQNPVSSTVPLILPLPDASLQPLVVEMSPELSGIWMVFLLAGEVMMLVAGADALRIAGKLRVCLWLFCVFGLLWTAGVFYWRWA